LPGTFPTSGEPLPIGSTISSIVTGNDPYCTTSDPHIEDGDGGLGLLGPCKTFVVTSSQTEGIEATVTWSNPSVYLTLLTPTSGVCCSSPLVLRLSVKAGSPTILGVGLHAPQDATAAQSFTLTSVLLR
jgi:hypothetical protein